MSAPSTSAALPFLSGEVPSMSDSVRHETLQTRFEALRPPNRGARPSFGDGYEAVGGIPARVIKPSEDTGTFTCHRFSRDGSLLAVGESNGSVRVWETARYTCVAEKLDVFKSAVESLAFLSSSNKHMVAVDSMGNTLSFATTQNGSRSHLEGTLETPSEERIDEEMIVECSRLGNPAKCRSENIFQRRTVQLCEDGSTASVAIVAWAAQGEIIVVKIWHIVYKHGQSGWTTILFRTHELIREGSDSPKEFDMHEHLSLSRDGSSLIALCRVLPDSVVVYPRIGSGDTHSQAFNGAECTHAAWGNMGKYVLIWSLDEDPWISIYETAKLPCIADEPPALAKMSLNLGLSSVEIQMHDDVAHEGHIEVMVSEIFKSGRTRIFRWDVTDNSIVTQVYLSFLPAVSIAKGEDEQTADSHFSLCVSRDQKWIGGLSIEHGICALASIETGTVMWSCDFPRSRVVGGPGRRGCVLFSPSQRHFLVFTEFAMFAFAPAVLNLDVPARLQTLTFGDLFDGIITSPVEEIMTAQLALPSLAKISKLISPGGLNWFLRNAIPNSLLDAWLGLDGENSLARGAHQELIDLCVSDCGQFLAYITRQMDQTLRVKLCSLGYDGYLSAHDFADLQFPLSNEFDEEDFIPSKLLFYPTESQEGMLLVSDESLPSVVFCDLTIERWKRLSLGIEKCFAFRQTEDRKLVSFLNVTGVCILDLVSQTIVGRIAYSVNFSHLKEETNNHLGDGSFEELLHCCGDQLVSDDGRTVGFGWDSKNEKSLVITPFTEMEECLGWFSDQSRKLKLDSDISGDGRCTLRWIYDQPMRDFGIYSISGNRSYLARSDLSGEHMCYAYISADCSSFTVLSADYRTFAGNYSEPVKLKKLGLYCAEQFCPDYQRLKQASFKKVAASVAKLVEDYGIYALNGPLSTGMTIVQEALLEDDTETVKEIKELCASKKIELSLDWVAEGNDVNNLLSEALKRKSTDAVANIMDFISSQSTPFIQTAASVRNRFNTLATQHPEILKSALTRNCFVFDTCQVRVHVKFVDAASREQSALHLGSTDDYFSWENVKDPEILEKKWLRGNKKIVRDVEKDGNKSTTIADLKFICIEDAAKTGMRGILRSLLMKKMPAHIFQTDAVRWIIEYKWHKIWKYRFYWSAARYAVFIGSVTVYAFIVGGSANISKELTWKQDFANCLMSLNFVFGCTMLKAEITRMYNRYEDGRQFFGSRLLGVRFYFSSRWNWLDLVFCSLLISFVPVSHVLEMVNIGRWKLLSASAAISTILAYVKVWYFAQVFQQTGAQVLMVGNIAKDSQYFLYLAFVILCGFAFSLRILFRHAAPENLSELGSSAMPNAVNSMRNATVCGSETDVQEAFGSPWMSLATLFFALLGDFDPSIYYSADEMPWLISALFAIYLISIVILLLNLLISIMSDTFDRVKSTERAQLLMGRARFMDACEAALRPSEMEKIDKNIQKYVYALTDIANTKDDGLSDQWSGKLDAIERRLRSRFQETENRTRDMMEKLENNVKETVEKALKKQEDRIGERLRRVQEQDDRLTTATNQQQTRATSEMSAIEDSITKNVQAAVHAQEIRITELVERRLAENNEQILETLRETRQSTQNQLDEVLSLLQGQHRQ